MHLHKKTDEKPHTRDFPSVFSSYIDSLYAVIATSYAHHFFL